MAWTLVNQEFDPKFVNCEYAQAILDHVGKHVDIQPLWMANPRPLLTKYLNWPTFRRLAHQPGPFHIESLYLPMMNVARLPRCVTTIQDLANALEPALYPCTFPERVEARLAVKGVRRCDAVITMAPFQKREMVERVGIPEEKVFVSNWGIDHALNRPVDDRRREALRAALRARLGIPEDHALLLYVGSWQPRKNIPGLFKIVNLLAQRGRKVKLLMRRWTGERDLWREPVERALAASGAERHVAWLWPMTPEERTDVYRAADVLLFPTYYEGFGLPPLEAMACGLPVVTSNRSTVPDVVGDGAITLDPDDHAGFADAIEALLDSDAERRALVQRGLRRAALFTWEAMVPGHLAAYESVERR